MGISVERRWWAVIAMSLALLASGLDLTVLNLALPTLATSLHASTTRLQWIVDSYSLVVSATLLPGGLLGDRYGRKKFLLIALVLFGASSLWCAYSTSAGELIAARAVLGVGAAMLVPLSLGVLPVLFNEDERPRAVTVLLSTTIVAYPLGPILGGWLLTHYWWGSVFLINVPVTVIAVIAVSLLLPESRSEQRPWLDVVGILTSSGGLALLTYGTIEAGSTGWGSATTVVSLIAGAIVLTLMVVWELGVRRRGLQPLVDLSLFRSAGFSWGTVLATVVSFAMFGLLFTVPQFFQDVRGTTAMGSGLRLLPLIGGLIIGSVLGDRLASLVGAKLVVALGLAVMAVGLILGTGTDPDTGTLFLLVWIGVVGAGVGLSLPTSMDAALARLSKDAAGVGSGLIQAVRQTGSTFGVAILGSVVSSAYQNRLHLGGLPAAAAAAARSGVAGGVAVAHAAKSPSLLHDVLGAFAHGMHVMLWVCGVMAVVGTVLALAFLPAKRKTPGGGTAGADADQVSAEVDA